MQVHSSTVTTLAASGDQLSGETVMDPVEEASVIVIVGEYPPVIVRVYGVLLTEELEESCSIRTLKFLTNRV